MRIFVDGKEIDFSGTSVGDLPRPDGALYALVNGRHVDDGRPLKDEDNIVFVRKNSPLERVIEDSLCQRYSEDIHSRISAAKIGIAGLGGIGSHLAMALVRSGVKNLVIADFDRVDATNLSRQNYSVNDIGFPKSDATGRILSSVSPGVRVESHDVLLNESNIPGIFKDCDIICEAMDGPESKAVFASCISESFPDKWLVCCSGMAGFGPTEEMTVKHPFRHMLVVGDGLSDNSEHGLVASRVMTCAGMMAHAVVRLILDPGSFEDNKYKPDE